MDKNYMICGQSISVLAPSFPFSHAGSELFESRKSRADISIMCFYSDSLPSESGECIFADENVRVYERAGTVTRFILAAGAPAAAAVIGKGGSSVYCYVKKSAWRELLGENAFWQTVSLPHLLLTRGCLTVSASLVGFCGMGILFLSQGGGVSAAAAGFSANESGARLLNASAAGISADDEPVAHSVPFYARGSCCKNRSVPLAAIVCPGEGGVCRLKGIEATMALFRFGRLDLSFQDEKALFRQHSQKILQTVPVYSAGGLDSGEGSAALIRALAEDGVLEYADALGA